MSTTKIHGHVTKAKKKRAGSAGVAAKDSKHLKKTTLKTHSVTWGEYDKDVRVLANAIKHLPHKTIYGEPRGGLVIATHLSHLTGKELLTSGICPSNTIIIDDVADTGGTLSKYKRFTTATLYRKDSTKKEPTICVRTINKWIVYPWEK